MGADTDDDQPLAILARRAVFIQCLLFATCVRILARFVNRIGKLVKIDGPCSLDCGW